MRRRIRLAACALLLSTAGATAPTPACAGDLLVGVLAHNADLGITVKPVEGGADVQLGYRTLPIPWLHWGDFRAHVIGEANLSGGVDFAAAGLSYRVHLGRGFYIAPGIGGAVQDGDAHQYQVRPDRLSLGSRVLFEPELTAGWRVTDRVSVEAIYDHLSHGQLAGAQNPGVDNIGVRLAWRLGPT